jgi:hypothetical protein
LGAFHHHKFQKHKIELLFKPENYNFLGANMSILRHNMLLGGEGWPDEGTISNPVERALVHCSTTWWHPAQPIQPHGSDTTLLQFIYLCALSNA